MPRRKIQRAFSSWLDKNHDRFSMKIRLGRRTDRFWEFSFVGINAAIQGALTTYEINVAAEYANDCRDLLLSLEAEPRQARGGGVFCDICLPEARRVFPDRPALWVNHLFEPFLDWVNDNLAKAKWLALHGDPDFATWARLLPNDDQTEHLRGGGCMINFSALTDKSPRAEHDSPPILLPCRVS
jgi:hypothetical protein